MVISTRDLEELGQYYSGLLTRVEASIDARLTEEAGYRDGKIMDEKLVGITPKIAECIERDYTIAGWKVEVIRDPKFELKERCGYSFRFFKR